MAELLKNICIKIKRFSKKTYADVLIDLAINIRFGVKVIYVDHCNNFFFEVLDTINIFHYSYININPCLHIRLCSRMSRTRAVSSV